MANKTNVTNGSVSDPYNEVEFEEFLKEIGNVNIQNWTLFAEALGVSRRTVIRWKKHPLAQAAISNAVQESIKAMTEVGALDWKMHREKLKMLGIKEKQTLEHELGDDLTELLDNIDGGEYDDLGSEATKQVVANDAPVQDKEQAGPNNNV